MGDDKLVEIGKVTHYFSKISVAVVKLTDSLSVGDKILIKGATTDIEQSVASMQIEHENVNAAKSGQSVGLKVEGRARPNDVVYKAIE
ncbi:MAG: translation elongation factor-like protein [Candidatus Hodarchaeota archaeon]